MEAKLYNQAGDQIGVIEVSDYIFGIEPNVSVMHQAMVRQQANARLGTHNTRGRSDVSGSTRKLYRQKGTGRARQGSIRAPHRRGGGVAHGPHPRSYEKKMPRKMRRLAVRSALSAKQAEQQIRFVDAMDFDIPRTKDMIAMLEAQGLSGKTLIVLDSKNENIYLSANNLPYVKTLLAHYLNVVDLLSFDNVILLVSAVEVVEGYLGNGEGGVSVRVAERPIPRPVPAAAEQAEAAEAAAEEPEEPAPAEPGGSAAPVAEAEEAAAEAEAPAAASDTDEPETPAAQRRKDNDEEAS